MLIDSIEIHTRARLNRLNSLTLISAKGLNAMRDEPLNPAQKCQSLGKSDEASS
jgi:hypothetical protein